METRAHHILIGLFTLALVAGLFGFVIWLARVEIDQEFDIYDIYFEGSVAGLSGAGEVRYNGVYVGRVRQISIDPEDPRRVLVRVEIAANTPVLENTVASLELQGLTGLSYVSVTTPDEPGAPLEREDGEAYPVIKSRRSQIQELFTGAPDLVNAAITLANRLSDFADEENRAAVAEILANLATVSRTLAKDSGALGRTAENVNTTLAEIGNAAHSIGTLAEHADGILDEDVAGLVREVRDAAVRIDQAVVNFDAGLNATAVPEFTRLIRDAQALVGSIRRIAERLETSPADFLLSHGRPEFEPQ